MAIMTSGHFPDTCGCYLEYTWDSTSTEANRVHNPTRFIPCQFHSNLTMDIAGKHGVIIDENSRKNVFLQTAVDNGPSALFDLNADGSHTLKKGITYSWTWSGTAPNRLLTVSFSGITLTTQQKTALQTKADTIFGSGKVVVI